MNNGQLFSEYFLNEGIKETQDYLRLDDTELKKLYKEFKKLYEDFAKRKSPDEADTEDGSVRPIIEKLGFTFSRQKKAPKAQKNRHPRLYTV